MTSYKSSKHDARLWIPATLLIPLLIYDTWFFFYVDHGRKVADYIGDTRVIHQYTNYALGFISLILGLMIGRMEDVRKYVGHLNVAPFLIALGCASFCIMFVPMPYGDAHVSKVKVYWIVKVALEQAIVIFTIYGMVITAMKVQHFSSSST